MKKLTALLLALTLTLSLAPPALAWEVPNVKYPSFRQYLDFYRASSDEDTRALARFLEDYLATHPEEIAAFDPYAWFTFHMAGNPGASPSRWFAAQTPDYGEAHFRAEMTNLWLTGLYRARREERYAADLVSRYPDDYAAFDADAWFAGFYGGILGTDKVTYMAGNYQTTEEAFRLAMFSEWVLGPLGHFNGLVVTVNGTPLQFQRLRGDSGAVAEPLMRGDRVLVPLRTVAEVLNANLEYDGASRTATCVKGGITVTFTLDRPTYSITSPEGTVTLTLDVPPSAEDGRTYVPLHALAEALGYAVTWNGPLRTAQLS